MTGRTGRWFDYSQGGGKGARHIKLLNMEKTFWVFGWAKSPHITFDVITIAHSGPILKFIFVPHSFFFLLW